MYVFDDVILGLSWISLRHCECGPNNILPSLLFHHQTYDDWWWWSVIIANCNQQNSAKYIYIYFKFVIFGQLLLKIKIEQSHQQVLLKGFAIKFLMLFLIFYTIFKK